MKHVLIFLVFILLVVGLLFTVSDTKAPRIPDDETHTIFYVEEVCWECHGPEGEVPRRKNHPPKDQCLECHKVKDDRRRGN
jgi:hypothetical protein